MFDLWPFYGSSELTQIVWEKSENDKENHFFLAAHVLSLLLCFVFTSLGEC